MMWCIELEIEEVRVTVNPPHHGQLTGAELHRAGDRGKSYSESASSRPTHWSFSRSRFTHPSDKLFSNQELSQPC